MRIELAGGVTVEADGRVVREQDLPGRQGRLVFAYLTVHQGRAVPREEIAEVLWPEGPSPSWPRTLASVVSRVRTALAAVGLTDAISNAFGCYRLTLPAGAEVDIEDAASAIEQAERALSGGDADAAVAAATRAAAVAARPLLPGDEGPWLDAQRARLRDVAVRAHETRGRALIATGAPLDAARAAEDALALEPYRETAWALLMRAHDAAGNRAEALRAYERCRSMLADELGVDPSPETQALHVEILRAETSRDRPRAPTPPAATAPPAPAGAPPPLPLPRTSFVGRAAEMDALRRALAGPGLVTVVGLGGTGKTRIALEAAAEAAEGGRLVAFAALGAVAAREDVVEAVAAATAPAASDERDPLAAVAAVLGAAAALLVLDNCEHVAADAASAAEALIARCPQLTILATSREPLGVAGERLLPLAPLALDDDGGDEPDAVRLFLERAAAARGGRSVDEAERGVVAAICRRVDGIPLAIELAAARARHLPLPEIAARLEEGFALLASRERAGVVRHRTLTAMLDWSDDLLEPSERVLFHRLSVFAAAPPLESVEGLYAEMGSDGDPPVVELLSSLVDKSLLTLDVTHAQPRYRMLDTVRAYALARLIEDGDEQRVRGAHARWYATAAEGLVALADERGSAEWLSAARDGIDDALAALRWAVDAREADVATRLVAALWRYWEARGRVAEGRARVEEALALASRDPARARALHGAASLALSARDHAAAVRLHTENLAFQESLGDRAGAARTRSALATALLYAGNVEEAERLGSEALTEMRALGDERGAAFALSSLGITAARRGDYEGALERFLQSLDALQRLGRKRDAAAVLTNLGNLADDRRDLGRAQRFFEGALQLYRDVGDDRGAALCLNNLSIVSRNRGDIDHAIEHAEDALTLFRRLEDRQGEAATLYNLGNLWLESDDPLRAQPMYEAAAQVYREMQDARGAAMALEGLAVAAREAGDRRRAWRSEGEAVMTYRALGLVEPLRRALATLADLAAEAGMRAIAERLRAAAADAVIEDDRLGPLLAEALAADPPPAATTPAERATASALSRRERDVARFVGAGLTNREIAEQLFISERTVESHIAHIRAKLGISSRTRLAVWAAQNGAGDSAPAPTA